MQPTAPAAPTQAPAQPQQSVDPSQFGEYSDWAQENMQKGVSAQSLMQTLQSQGINPTAAPAQPQQKGNWFERLLPTIGGIAGGALGSLTDIFDGPLGTIGGSAAGGALGQELENKLTGSKGSTAAAGVENAVGAGVGGALGKIGSLFAGKVVAPLAEKGATQLVADQAPGVTKDLAEYLVKDNGITDLGKAGNMAKVLTGGAGGANQDVEGTAILNKYVEDTLANNGPKQIAVNDLSMSPATGKGAALAESVANENNLLQQAITNNSLAGTPQANAIRSQLSGIFKGLESDNPEGTVAPSQALDAQRQVSALSQEHYQNYLDGGRSNTTELNMAKTLGQISDTLKSRLSLDNIPVSDEDKAALVKDIAKFGGPISKDAAANVGTQIQGAKSLSDIRNIESNWVQVSKTLQKAADMANKNFGRSATDMARSTLPVAGAISGAAGPKSILGTIGGMATSSPAADKVGANILSKVSGGARSKLIQDILPLATRAAATGAANMPNIAASGGTGGAGGALPTNAVSSGTGAGMTPTASPIDQVFQTLLAQEQAAPASFASSLGPVLGSLAPTVQKQELGGQVASSLLPAFAGAGGAQGMGGGLLSQLSGLIPGTAANTYGRQQSSTASVLAQLLGISPQEAMMLTPQLMQNSSSAAVPATNINSILGTIGAQ
jgi:hypothetical protein